MGNPEKPFAIIPLTHGKVAIVDPHRYNALRMFTWRAVKAQHNWYAKTTLTKNGKTFDISMHRFVARTPFGQVCHHKNRNSLDNREANLVNMVKSSHSTYHHDNNLIVKFKPTPLEVPASNGATPTETPTHPL